MRFGNSAGSYELTSLPGNSQVCVSHNAFIFEEHRGKGVGNEIHRLRLDQMRALGYDAAICTVKDENKVQLHILEKNGWTRAMTFRSSYTGNLVHLYVKTLREK